MPKAVVLLADGFETVEALTAIDVLRRAGVKSRLVSIMGTAHVISAQQVQVTADKTLDTLDAGVVDCIVIPGGMPGVKRLMADGRVASLLAEALADPAKTVGAICAGPMVLAENGLLEGRRATVFPGCEDPFPEGCLTDEDIVVDGNLVTARAMSCSLPFAIELVKVLAGPEAAGKVAEGVGNPDLVR